MEKMEQLIRFPYPLYNDSVKSLETLIEKPYCLCYQFEVNENGYGPYGFDTEKSKELLKKLFEGLYFWHNGAFIKNDNYNLRSGIYFYNEEDWIKSYQKLVYRYNYELRKTSHLKQSAAIDKPLLLNYPEKNLDPAIINELIKEKIKFFISKFFTPEAGQCIVLFDLSLIPTIKELTREYSIRYKEVGSFDELKPW